LATIEQRLTEMLEPAVDATGYELLGVEFVSAGKHSVLRIYIDHPQGITVDDCAEVSYQVSAILDVEDPISTEYNLEVSSPGMERPLFKAAHYEKVIGDEIFLQLRMPVENQRKWKGKLIALEGEIITLEANNKQQRIALSNIKKAHVIPQFD
jgi:ribosome maturation factor RimP